MREWMKEKLKAIFCQRVLNAVFAMVCVAGALGWSNVAVMLASAVLYLLLAVIS